MRRPVVLLCMLDLHRHRDPDLLSAIINNWGTLAKLRPLLLPVIVSSLATWTPRQLEGCPASSVKSVEKVIRILLIHISRCVRSSHVLSISNACARGPNAAQFAIQIPDALQQQATRMEQAAQDERIRREAAAAEATLKRSMPSTDDEKVDAKRIKLEHPTDNTTSTPPVPDVSLTEFLKNFDFSALPVGLVADLVIANLQMLPESSLTVAIEVRACHRFWLL